MMHPDAEAVHSALWSPDSPVERRNGVVTLTIRGKSTQTPLDADRADAERIARALVPDAEFVSAFYTHFNHEPILTFVGTSLTDLARRRG